MVSKNEAEVVSKCFRQQIINNYCSDKKSKWKILRVHSMYSETFKMLIRRTYPGQLNPNPWGRHSSVSIFWKVLGNSDVKVRSWISKLEIKIKKWVRNLELLIETAFMCFLFQIEIWCLNLLESFNCRKKDLVCCYGYKNWAE